MNSNNTDKTPCFVQTQQGVSIEYKNKLLYSKYNPSKNIELLIEKLNVLPGTIFLCCSPILNYGLQSLINKIADDCLVILCEKESELRPFINNYYSSEFIHIQNVIFPSLQELFELPILLNKKEYLFSDNKKINSGKYKRIVRIDFSTGIQFNPPFYNELELASINAIKTFWINRVTLTKFGRKYSHNLFENLSTIYNTKPIQKYFNSIKKPIIICGAGESLNQGINDFKDNRNDFYILAVDTAANFLIKNNIIPDGIFIEEAQNIILKSFFDINKHNKCHIFAGLSSIPNLSHYINNNSRISYFFTEYTNADFLNNLQKYIFFPKKNPAFGSVGLTTTYYALAFRQSEKIPVYIYGLDFAYSLGVTHVKNSIANKERLIRNSKLNKISNYSSAYINAIKVSDNTYTTINLQNYSELFKSFFSTKQNLFDSRNFGLSLNLPYNIPTRIEYTNSNSTEEIELYDNDYIKQESLNYLQNEYNALILIKDILTNKNPEMQNKAKEEINTLLSDLLYSREYLYLHFIDGYQLSLNIDFLKRIRTEIDSYIKLFGRLIKNR